MAGRYNDKLGQKILKLEAVEGLGIGQGICILSQRARDGQSRPTSRNPAEPQQRQRRRHDGQTGCHERQQLGRIGLF